MNTPSLSLTESELLLYSDDDFGLLKDSALVVKCKTPECWICLFLGHIQSNFRIKDKMGTPVLSIVEKLFLLGNHPFLTVYLIFDCTMCIRLSELSEK